MLRKVILHGEAADKFGREFVLDVDTLGEAGRALAAVVPGFREFATSRHFKCVAGPSLKEGLELDKETLDFRLGNRPIHIMPVYAGAGSGKAQGLGKILAGILLIGIGLFLVPAGATLAGMSASQMTMLGVGMLFKGLSALMAAEDDEEKDDESDQFQGSIPMARHGSPVPLFYGRTLYTQPKAISGGVSSHDVEIE